MRSTSSGLLATLALVSLSCAAPPKIIEHPGNEAIVKRDDNEVTDLSDENATRSPDPIIRTAVHPKLYGCVTYQQDLIKEAWRQAGQVAQAHTLWAGGKPPFNNVTAYYLGKSANKEGDPFWHTGPLKQNVKRQYGLHKHNQFWSPAWAHAYFYCEENLVPHKPEKPPPLCQDPTVPFYTFSDIGSVIGWDAYYVVFCNKFFNEAEANDLDVMINAAEIFPVRYVNPFWRTRARWMLEASYSFYNILRPNAHVIYGMDTPIRQAEEAAQYNTGYVEQNPASWATTAIAVYAQHVLDLNWALYARPRAQSPLQQEGDYNLTSDALVGRIMGNQPDWFAAPPRLNGTANSDSDPDGDPVGGVVLDDPDAEEDDPAAFAVPGGGPGNVTSSNQGGLPQGIVSTS